MQDDADWSTLGVKEVSSAKHVFLQYRSSMFHVVLHLIDPQNLLFSGSKANDGGYS